MQRTDAWLRSWNMDGSGKGYHGVTAAVPTGACIGEYFDRYTL